MTVFEPAYFCVVELDTDMDPDDESEFPGAEDPDPTFDEGRDFLPESVGPDPSLPDEESSLPDEPD